MKVKTLDENKKAGVDMKNKNIIKLFKTLISKLVLIILIAFSLQGSCFAYKRIVGNGHIVSKNYSFDDKSFNALEFQGFGDLKVNIKDNLNTADVIITMDSNLLPYMEVYVKNNILYIGCKDGIGIRAKNKKQVMVNTSRLQSLTTHGSSVSIVEGIESDLFTANLHGSSKVNLQGEAKKLITAVYGSGKIDAKKLQSEEAKVSISGSGSAVIGVTKKLDMKVHGSGCIKYYGNPKELKQQVFGSGKIVSVK